MSETQTAPKVLVIELINQQPSNFVLDGAGEESDLPTHISAPNARKIRNVSKVKYVVPKGQKDAGMTKLRSIRYIKGCDLIYVDEQDAAGFKPNPAVDVIWILNGKHTVIENQGDIGEFRYLKAFEGNVDNPDRPDNAVGIYREINTTVEAVGTENIFDDEIKVLKYLDSLKKKTGNNQYTYNEDSISFLCDLFKLPPFDDGFKSEAWVSLAIIGKQDPKKFLTTIASLVAVIEADVNQAISKGVISMDEEKSFFTVSQKVITIFSPNSTSDERREELVDFFANPENRLMYDNLRADLHQKKVKAAEVVS